MNQKKIERVAKTICWTSSRKTMDGLCVYCENKDKHNCPLVNQFAEEAIAVIRELER